MMGPLLIASYLTLWILVLMQAVLLLLIYRHFGLMAMGTGEGVQRDGIPVGEVAPTLMGTAVDGQRVEWRAQLRSPHVVLFASPGCEPCEEVLPALRELALTNKDVGAIVVVPGLSTSAAQLAEKFDLPFACIAEDTNGIFRAWRVRVTPFAFVIGGDGRVHAKGLCNDAFKLHRLMESAGIDCKVPIGIRRQLQAVRG